MQSKDISKCIYFTPKQKGIACIIFSSLCFAVMNLCAKSAGTLPSIQKAFFRNAIAAVLAFIMVYKSSLPVIPKKHTIGFLLLRSCFGTLGLIANFYGVSHLPLADSAILAKLAPFFTIFFSFLFLHEYVRFSHIFAAMCAFTASLLIIKPGFATSGHTMAALIACAGGMCAGGSYTCVRYLLGQGEHPPFIVFFFSVFSLLLMFPFFVYGYHAMSVSQALLLLAAGMAGAGGQFGITIAYSYAPARNIAVFDYMQILFSALFGMLLFSESPDIYSITGYIIICSIAVVLFLQKQ